MRSFDPLRVGRLECAMWVAYYRRRWWRLLVAAIALVHHTFGLPWRATLRAAWLALRANQLWARDDADGARRAMRRVYALVAVVHDVRFDVERAAWLEVEWWRAHREAARDAGGEGGEGGPGGAGGDGDSGGEGGAGDAAGEGAIADALVALYAHIYGVAPADVRLAAQQRALAMRHSDRWVAEGCREPSELIDAERAALVRSYAALLAAVHAG
jgi:hypothetical protein